MGVRRRRGISECRPARSNGGRRGGGNSWSGCCAWRANAEAYAVPGPHEVTQVYTPLSEALVFSRSSQLGAITAFGAELSGIQELANEEFVARAPSVMKPLLLTVPVMKREP